MASRSLSTLVCGDRLTMCISNSGDVLSFGYSYSGSHGHDEEQVYSPKKIPTLESITYIAVGEAHSVCLQDNGVVYTFGNNFYGQLGVTLHSRSQQTYIPKKVNLPACKQVACGYHFTMCLTEDGILYSFGLNNFGQLGVGGMEKKYNMPQCLESLKDIEFIECNLNDSFCKASDNQIYCWGKNEYGTLGLGNRICQNIPILCSSLSNEDIVDIKCGNCHTLILTSNGDVLSCGWNNYGQLGREIDNDCSLSFQKIEKLSEISRIECGRFHSMCIDSNNDLIIFGYNGFGQLGLGDTDNRYDPIKHPTLSNIIDISKGGRCTFVKTLSNVVYAFGNNSNTQLGTKTKDKNQTIPIQPLVVNKFTWYSINKSSKVKSARSIKS